MHDQRGNNRESRVKFLFELNYEQGELDYVLYSDRDFTADCRLIFNSVRKLKPFEAHECELEMDSDNNKFAICFEDAAILYQTSEDIRALLGETLADLGLYAHFNPSVYAPDSCNSRKYIIIYDKEHLPHVIHKTLNEKELEEMNFPLTAVPTRYRCGYRGKIMDIPCCDFMKPEVLFDYATLKRELRQNDNINPVTKCSVQHIAYDYGKRDEVMNFMEKVRLVYEENLPYEDYMDDILNDGFSAIAFEEKLASKKKEQSALEVGDLFSKGKEAYKALRYSNAIYCFQQTSARLENADNKDEATLVNANAYCALAQLKTGDVESAITSFEELSNETAIQGDTAYSILLTNLANHYLKKENLTKAGEKENFAKAEDLLQKAGDGFQPGKSVPAFLRWRFEKKLYQQLTLLSRFKAQNNFSGHCQAFHGAAGFGTLKDLQSCIEHLFVYPDVKDTNPDEGFTALHWVICEERLPHAWLLKNMGASFNIRNACCENERGVLQGGKTALDMIKASENEEMKLLLQPFIRLTINLKNVAKDEESHNELIVKSLDLLLEKLGLAEFCHAVYLSPVKDIILAPLFLTRKLLDNFTHFCGKTIGETPELCELYTLKEVFHPPGQVSLLTSQKLCFTFRVNQELLQQSYIQFIEKSYDNYYLSSETLGYIYSIHSDAGCNYHMDYIRQVSDFLPSVVAGIVNLAQPHFIKTLARDPSDFGHFTVSLPCESADYLHGFLQHFINHQLRLKFGDRFTCEEISEVRPENTPEPAPQPTPKLRR